MVQYPGEFWKDYELVDSGEGEKLERFGNYYMVRPEPKALWHRTMPADEWDRTAHTRFRPGAGFSKAGKEDSGTCQYCLSSSCYISSRFIFHTLHSLDKWFVNPAEYKYDENSSGGVAENLSVISSYRQGFDAAPGVVISRENLEKYAVSVAQKIRIYLAKLSDKMLSEKLDGCEFTRLELILGQFRHVMCHAGISSAINAQNGNGWLKYFGLD